MMVWLRNLLIGGLAGIIALIVEIIADSLISFSFIPEGIMLSGPLAPVILFPFIEEGSKYWAIRKVGIDTPGVRLFSGLIAFGFGFGLLEIIITAQAWNFFPGIHPALFMLPVSMHIGTALLIGWGSGFMAFKHLPRILIFLPAFFIHAVFNYLVFYHF